MTFDAATTLVVLVAVVVLLGTGRIRAPSTAMLGAVVALVLLGVLSPADAFAGAGNPAVVTIAALLVLARAVQEAGSVRWVVATVLGNGLGERRVLTRIIAPVAGLSAFLNNTPIVAALAPMVRTWAHEHGRSPSKYLIPLSFAAVLGGLATTIGTSTNLVASGIAEARGDGAFGIFEVTAIGLPAALVGCVVLVLLAPRTMPERIAPGAEADPSEYEFHIRVVPDGPLVGRSVTDAGLRNLAGVYLARLDRSHTTIAPVSPDEELRGGDVLTFVGNVHNIRDLTAIAGLESDEAQHVSDLDVPSQRYYEAVVGPRSSLVGNTLKEVGFRSTYGAAVMGIRRAGERLDVKLGSVELVAGDVLLLLSDHAFGSRVRGTDDFALVTDAAEHRELSRTQVLVTTVAVLATVGLAGFGILPILEASLLAVAVVLGGKVISAKEARDALDLDVLLTVAGSLGLGLAVAETGLADDAAELLAVLGEPLGALGALAALLLATSLLTEVLSNTATAALMVPVAYTLAATTGADPRGYVIATAIGASNGFLTPIGYQTNLLVQGIGGYRYGDYWRLGLPVELAVLLTTLVLVPVIY